LPYKGIADFPGRTQGGTGPGNTPQVD